MSCPDHTTLTLFVDGETEPERSEEVRRHIAECGACREEVESVRNLERTVRFALASIPVGSIRSTIPETRSGWRSGFRLAAVAALAFALVLSLILFSPIEMELPRNSDKDEARSPLPEINPEAFSDETFESWAGPYKDLKIPLVPMDEVLNYMSIAQDRTLKSISTL